MMRRFVLILLACVLAPATVQAQVTFDAASNAGSSSAASLTFAHTVSGANRYLVCGTAVQNPTKTVTSITFNGVSLNKLTSQDNTDDPSRQSRAEYWYLIAPDATTANVVVTLNSATAVAAGCVSYTGVEQSTPHGTAATTKGDAASTSVTATSAAGELVVDVTSIRVGTTTITVGAGQTQRVQKQSAAGVGNATIGMSQEAGAASVAMTWTVDDGLAKAWTAIAVSLKPSAGVVGTTITVCAAGCDYTNALLQTAMNAATCGTTILLETAHSYPAPSDGWVMGKKCASPTWDSITFRTGVTSTGTVMSTALFPAAGVRATAADATIFAKMSPTVNNEAALRTVYPGETGPECAGLPCTGDGWTVQWIEFTPKIDWAQRALVRFGTNKAGKELQGGVWVNTLPGGETQDTLVEVPQYLSLIQCYIHGDPFIGQHQGITVSSKDTRIWDNLIDDIKSQVETQAITGVNDVGPYDVRNNELNATGENIMWGGSDTYLRLSATVSGTPTTTTIDLSSPVWNHLDGTTEVANLATDIYNNIFISIIHGGTEYGSVTCAISGSTCTLSPALTFTPTVGDIVRWSWVTGGLTFVQNWLLKKPAWMLPVFTPPATVTTTAGTGGSLAAGQHCYRVVTQGFVSGDSSAQSVGSTESCKTTVASGTVTITWTADANANNYRVFGGPTGAQAEYWDVSPPTTTYVDTGVAGTAGTLPTNPTYPFVKNNFELKRCDGRAPAGACLIEGNVIDYAWCCSQNNIVSLKSNNQNTNDPSATIRNLAFQNNWVRHGNRAIGLTCTNTGNTTPSPSGVMTDVTIANNLFTDLSSTYVAFPGTVTNSAIFMTSGSYSAIIGSRGCIRVSFTHNTFSADANNLNGPMWIQLASTADKMVDLVVRDNIMARDCITASCVSNGNQTLKGFAPNNLGNNVPATAWNGTTTGASFADHNAWPDGSGAMYTAGPFTSPFFIADATIKATHMVNYTTCKSGVNILGCGLLGTSSMHSAASDLTDVGANVATIKAFTDLALSGNGSAVVVVPTYHGVRWRLRIRGVDY